MKQKGEFLSKHGPTLPLGAIVEIDGASWEVIGKDGADYKLSLVCFHQYENFGLDEPTECLTCGDSRA